VIATSGLTRRAIVALVALLVPLAALVLAEPTAAQTPTGSLTGQLLVASETMSDPRFARTVILMVKHDKDGAFGIVINRPVAERSLAELLEMLGDSGATADGKVRIFSGGPVQPELGFVIHSTDYQGANTIEIDGRVAMTSNRDIMRDIAAGKGPRQSLIAFGYAGWRAGQLEGEIALRAWATAPGGPAMVFDEDRAKLWENALARRTQDL
jgi:putative transcriptional regulator